jgi:hypothetical protein
MSINEWTVASKIESHGDAGHVGVQVSVLLPRELTENDQKVLSRLTEQIQNSLLEESLHLDPVRQGENKTEREKITGLFPQPIFVRKITNGYCSKWCCADRPWFVVTTSIGPITIGWRKRVLSIDWSDTSVTKSAQDLFPGEDVTKGEKSIHAWGYGKARQYISVLLAQKV